MSADYQKREPRILVLDDKREVTNRISSLLKAGSYRDVEVRNYLKNLRSLHRGYDLMLCDIVWPENQRVRTFGSLYAGFDVAEVDPISWTEMWRY